MLIWDFINQELKEDNIMSVNMDLWKIDNFKQTWYLFLMRFASLVDKGISVHVIFLTSVRYLTWYHIF